MPSLLPPNASKLERNIESLTERLELLPPDFESIWNANTCSVAMLPWLAWAFSVDEWDANRPEAQQRQVINDSVFIHKHKGTRAAVERALSSIDLNTTIVEWFEQNPPSNPYTFLITGFAPATELTVNEAENIYRLVNAAKNLRSHYSLDIPVRVDGSVFIGGVVMSGQEVEIFYQGYES
ncbi:MAG: phage tail protein I [Agitococcus sp.]|nr:phage tail protein I [Agitococcus sp.]